MYKFKAKMTPERLKKVEAYRVKEFRNKKAATTGELINYLMQCDSTFDSIEKTRFYIDNVNDYLKECRQASSNIFEYGLNTVENITNMFYIASSNPMADDIIKSMQGGYRVINQAPKWRVYLK